MNLCRQSGRARLGRKRLFDEHFAGLLFAKFRLDVRCRIFHCLEFVQVSKKKEAVLGQQNVGEAESEHYCRIGHIYWMMGGTS